MKGGGGHEGPGLNSTSFEFNAGETERGEGRLLCEKHMEKYGSV